MSLNKRKFTLAVGFLKHFDSKHTKIQKKKLLVFPDLQETADATEILEFIKIRLSICHSRSENNDKRVRTVQKKIDGL